ncbi:MAG TPA: transcriptional repressor [Acidimicrobiia bacterium]|nr:transcriptional repressor [Acidimicrobiia bacterium]
MSVGAMSVGDGSDGGALDREDLHVTVGLRLRAAARRYSRSRHAVVETLAAAGRPLSIPEILDAGSHRDLAQSSTYRNLGELVDVGVVRRVESGDDHARFELHESLTGHHHHLVCLDCGRVEDFDVTDEFEAGIEGLVGEAVDRGFSVESHRFDMLGRCPACIG